MGFAFIVNKDFITVTIDCEPKTISVKHRLYEEIKQAIFDEKWDLVEELIDIATACIKYLGGKLEVHGSSFTYDGIEVTSRIVEIILKMRKAGEDPTHLIKFIDNLMQNPNNEAISDLFDFISEGKMPVTEDGHFLAYRAVSDDFMDHHTKTMDNSVGNTVIMRREDCELNRNVSCSTGLHFCAKSYLSMYSRSKVVIVKVNPKDVTSIPTDYNQAKGRCCKFEVLSVYDEKHEDQVFQKLVVDDKDISLTKKEKTFVKAYNDLSKYPTIAALAKKLLVSPRTVQRRAAALLSKGVKLTDRTKKVSVTKEK